MVGLTLGVAVLITVLSVMNGFDRELKIVFWEWYRKRQFHRRKSLRIGLNWLNELKIIPT